MICPTQRARLIVALMPWIAACSSGGSAPARDAGPPADASLAADAGDAVDGADVDDAAIAAGEAGVDQLCVFNSDCQAALRCECSEATGCACKVGARGAGALGSPCVDGNDCASALCVEGPSASATDAGAVFLCSDACDAGAECPPSLPICSDIALIGMICIRQP